MCYVFNTSKLRVKTKNANFIRTNGFTYLFYGIILVMLMITIVVRLFKRVHSKF